MLTPSAVSDSRPVTCARSRSRVMSRSGPAARSSKTLWPVTGMCTGAGPTSELGERTSVMCERVLSSAVKGAATAAVGATGLVRICAA
ncbi:hypothetical protein AB0C29_17630 [Actinoplanes sp. NPDC048791]|uniref:hypothetical protein n=1 Tax=Actinoplanes sp. NPDC048791 TaxID=3154623 RepID=UPI0033F81272